MQELELQEHLEPAFIGHSMDGGDIGSPLDVMALLAYHAVRLTMRILAVLCHTTLIPNALVALEPKANQEFLGLPTEFEID